MNESLAIETTAYQTLLAGGHSSCRSVYDDWNIDNDCRNDLWEVINGHLIMVDNYTDLEVIPKTARNRSRH